MCTHSSCKGHDRGAGAGTDRRRLLLGATALGLAGAVGLPARLFAAAAKLDLPKPGPQDRCPVCGMFPARYPEWIATVVFKDGHADHFDGAKDMFKYLLDMGKYASGRKAEDIKAVGVTSYYGSELIAAADAVFVAGSDVYGPMGHELIPLADDAESASFMKDHKGQRVLRQADVTAGFLAGLDAGKFDAQ